MILLAEKVMPLVNAALAKRQARRRVASRRACEAGRVPPNAIFCGSPQ